MNIETANQLVQLRKENNLSQEALAEKLGVSRQAVSKWERAEASPDTDNLVMLAKLYHISLDELLLINVKEGNAQEDTSAVEEDNGEEDGQGTSWKEDYVHVGLNGFHVKDKDGEVHVGWDGIHVDDNKGGDSVHIDKNGIYVNGEKKEEEWFADHSHLFADHSHFPMALVTVMLYIVIGVLFKAWHPGWLLFLLIPIWESLVTAVKKKNARRFAYPVVCALFFLCMGIFFGLWHPGWVWFVTIPLYYGLIEYFYARKQEKEGGEEENWQG